MAWTIDLNNPGAIGGSSNKYSFPDPITGAAAQFDLLNRKYTGMTLGDALTKWSGNQSASGYSAFVSGLSGITPDTVLTSDILNSPQGLSLAQGMARWEAGTQFPLDLSGWQAAQAKVFGGGGIGVSGMSKAATATIDGGVLAGSTSESWLTTIEHWFVRGAIIALGFVFVFGGLVMMSAGVIEGSMRRRVLRSAVGANKATTKVRRAQAAAIGKPAPAPQITIHMPEKAPTGPRAPRRTKAQMIGEARSKIEAHDSAADLKSRTINVRKPRGERSGI